MCVCVLEIVKVCSCVVRNVASYLCMFVTVCVTEKDKNPYTRQRSAPQFRSHGSRLGLNVFTNYVFPGMITKHHAEIITLVDMRLR